MNAHISPTQLNMYFKCGESYRRRYVEGHKIPPSVSMCAGGAVHKGAEVNYRAKLITAEDLPVEQVLDATADEFDARIRDGVRLLPEEATVGQEIVLGKGKDSAVRMAALHRKMLAPTVQPALVEQRIEIKVPGLGPSLLGIVDLATKDRIVVDLKTGSKALSADAVHRSLQLTCYDVAYEALTGERPAGLMIHEVVDTETPTARPIPTTRDDRDRLVLANHLQAFERGVSAGVFPPAAPGSWWCSLKWCGFAPTCPYFPSHRGDQQGG